MEHLFFYLGLSLILTHEMVAIRLKEWSIFPGLSSLDDNTGYLVYTLLHFPLFFFMFYGLCTNQIIVIKGLDIFFIVHIGLHLVFLRHKKNQFKSLLSWTIISFVGLFGILDLVFTV